MIQILIGIGIIFGVFGILYGLGRLTIKIISPQLCNPDFIDVFYGSLIGSLALIISIGFFILCWMIGGSVMNLF